MVADHLVGLVFANGRVGFSLCLSIGLENKVPTFSITGSFTTIALALIGVLCSREELTLINIVGIVLSSVGVILINIK